MYHANERNNLAKNEPTSYNRKGVWFDSVVWGRILFIRELAFAALSQHSHSTRLCCPAISHYVCPHQHSATWERYHQTSILLMTVAVFHSPASESRRHTAVAASSQKQLFQLLGSRSSQGYTFNLWLKKSTEMIFIDWYSRLQYTKYWLHFLYSSHLDYI